MASIAASQAVDPGSIPGQCILSQGSSETLLLALQAFLATYFKLMKTAARLECNFFHFIPPPAVNVAASREAHYVQTRAKPQKLGLHVGPLLNTFTLYSSIFFLPIFALLHIAWGRFWSGTELGERQAEKKSWKVTSASQG